MKSFILMLSFFTRLPVPYVEYEEKLYIKGIKTIPFVGIVLGLILYVVSFVNLWFDPEVTAVVLLMTYIFMTGGLHLVWPIPVTAYSAAVNGNGCWRS